MMTAKARGKNQIVLYDDAELERPEGEEFPSTRDVRSVAHMKMLQSLGGKLNRLNDVRQIGNVIATELRSLIDYHNCRVSIVEGDDVIPIAFVGQFTSETQEPLEILACKVGQGITGRVAETGESLLIGDAANCEFARVLPGTDAIDESQVVVPLTYGTRVVGIIVISKLGLNQFDEDDVRLLEVLAGHAAVALENAGLYEAARREAERATALLEFSRQLSTAEGMDEVVGRIVERSARTLGSPRASVWLQETAGEELRVRATHGYTDLDRERLSRMHFDHESAEHFFAGNEPFVVTDEQRATINGVNEVDARSRFAVAPLTLDGGRLGCIAVAAPEDGEFSERHLRLLAGVAHQAKLALTNAGNFQSLEKTFLSTVEALANALEANDEYTSSHARWITDLALKVGEGLGLETRSLKQLELGALFHDIGKIGIPEAILSQAGPVDGGGAQDRREASRAGRADHRADRPARRSPADRPALPRALRRHRLSRSQARRGHSDRVADHPGLRRVPRDDHRPALPQAAPEGGGATAARRRRRDAVRPRGGRGLQARSRRVLLVRPRAAAREGVQPLGEADVRDRGQRRLSFSQARFVLQRPLASSNALLLRGETGLNA